MYTDTLCPDVLYYRLRSARQRKRAQKEDFDKQLIQLDEKRESLWDARHSLPMVPLKEPYQKGWKRSFILRADIAKSDSAAFYSGILEKINSTQYHHNKSFTKKRRRHGKRVYEPIPQLLKFISEWEWSNGKLKLTEEEKACFDPEIFWVHKRANVNIAEIRFVFRDAWRYVLQVQPNMITQVKMKDAKLEQEVKLLDNYIENNQLRYRMHKLTNGRSQNKWKRLEEKVKGKDLNKNKAFHTILEECII